MFDKCLLGLKLINSDRKLKEINKRLLVMEEELNEKYTVLRNKEEVIRLWREKYKSIVEVTSDIIWDYDLDTNEICFSDRLMEIMGYNIHGKIEYATAMNSIHPNDRHSFIKEIENYISKRTLYFQCEFRVKPRTGNYKWVLCRGKGVEDEEGNIHRILGSLSDITDRKESEEKLIKLAYYDSLTGLPNRVLFNERIDSVLSDAKSTGQRGSVLFIDLDNFKKVNDSLGHDYGDQLIKLCAQMLKLTVDKNDELCRFGGDEFIIQHPHNDNSVTDVELAKKILNIFDCPFEIGEKQIYISASIGIASYPNDGADVSTILKNADAAMYEAKRAGKNAYCFYNRKVVSEIIKKNELEKRMRTAIENNEFYLCYQPQFDVNTERFTSIEALIRWSCPEVGVIMPGEFIPIAEESGFIIQIGEWVFESACKQSKEWKDKGYGFDFIGVNISPIQLKSQGFIDMVKKAFYDTSADFNSIEVEITENVLIEPFHQSIEELTKLQNMGVKIALDDFGTGYSSLNYLKMLPITTIKIDKSFIDNICIDPDGISIVEGIISLAHKMNLTITAEGVETEEQFRILKEKQCDKIQGYFISRPLLKEEAEELLKKQSNNLKTIC